MELAPPEFNGKDLPHLQIEFLEFFKLTGRLGASDEDKCRLILGSVKKPEVKTLLRDLRRRASSFGEFLSFLEEAFPSLESDAKIIQDIRSIPALPETPAPHQVTNLRNLISAKILDLRESPTSHQKLEWLWSKIPDAIWDELKKKEYQARIHSYDDVFQVLMELAEHRERVDFMSRYRPKPSGSSSKPQTKKENLKLMSHDPEAGASTPESDAAA